MDVDDLAEGLLMAFGGYEPDWDDDDYYQPQEWKFINLIGDVKEQLKQYRDKHEFTSYSQALEYLIKQQGIPVKHKRKYINVNNHAIRIWKETYIKLKEIMEKGKFNYICEVVAALLINDKGE